MGVKSIIGAIMAVIGILLVILTVISAFMLPFFPTVMGAEDPEYLDDWISDADEGEMLTVYGEIGSKNILTTNERYSIVYTFKGSDVEIYGVEDFVDEGSDAMLDVKKIGGNSTELEFYVRNVALWGPNVCCVLLSGILATIGIVLFLVGRNKKVKHYERRRGDDLDIFDRPPEKKAEPPGMPPQGPQGGPSVGVQEQSTQDQTAGVPPQGQPSRVEGEYPVQAPQIPPPQQRQ